MLRHRYLNYPTDNMTGFPTTHVHVVSWISLADPSEGARVCSVLVFTKSLDLELAIGLLPWTTESLKTLCKCGPL